MRKRTKILIKLWVNRIIVLIFLALIVRANVLRLRDNDFANYEKVADYGRIREDDEQVKPVIAAIFYKGKNKDRGYISSYFNHTDNYRKKNVKIVVVPKKITAYSLSVIEKLYEEIGRYNKVRRIALVYSGDSDAALHKKMLKQVTGANDVKEIAVSEENPSAETQLNDYFAADGDMVVFLADLNKGLDSPESDFLTGEAVYFAQKYFYQLNVFDMIDTQMAQSLEKGYDSIYPLITAKDVPLLLKQKHNLENYRKHYWHVLSSYMELNLLQALNGNAEIMPPRDEENYRLYDRGKLVLKAYDENYLEIFENSELDENESMAKQLVRAVQALAAGGKIRSMKFAKVYLLTDFEYIRQAQDMLLMSYLDADDGIYAEYKGKAALLVADDRPDNPEELASAVRKKAGIPEDTDDSKIKYYKFKTVEMQYGD